MLLKMLSEFLEKRVNSELSPKMKLIFESDARAYFKKRAEIEEHILKTTDWLIYFTDNITEPEFENAETLDDSDLLTVHQIFIQVLKKSIDSHQENEAMCTKVLALYRKSKIELENRFSSYPRENSFEDYLGARTEREQKENVRKTGEYCYFCGSRNVKSHGDMFKCFDCSRKFKKRS